MSHTLMAAQTVLAAGQGTSGVKNVVDNGTRTLQYLGGGLATLAVIVVAVLIIFGAMNPNGNIRQHLGKIMLIAAGCILLGGGAAIVPALIGTGGDIGSTTTVQQTNGGVN